MRHWFPREAGGMAEKAPFELDRPQVQKIHIFFITSRILWAILYVKTKPG